MARIFALGEMCSLRKCGVYAPRQTPSLEKCLVTDMGLITAPTTDQYWQIKSVKNCTDCYHRNLSMATLTIEPNASQNRERSHNELKLAKKVSNTFQIFNDVSKRSVLASTAKNNLKNYKLYITLMSNQKQFGRSIRNMFLSM